MSMIAPPISIDCFALKLYIRKNYHIANEIVSF